jgi:hypothetical protein
MTEGQQPIASDAQPLDDEVRGEIAAWVDRTLKSAGISYASASSQLGLPRDAISKVVNGARDLSAPELLRLGELVQQPWPLSPLPDATSVDGSHARLIEARVAAGFRSARAASEHHGWIESSYRSHENGARPIKRAAAIEYGRGFGVTADWILSGIGEPPVPADPVSSPTSNGTASMTEVGPGQYRLRIDKVVPRTVALQIVALLPDE